MRHFIIEMENKMATSNIKNCDIWHNITIVCNHSGKANTKIPRK